MKGRRVLYKILSSVASACSSVSTRFLYASCRVYSRTSAQHVAHERTRRRRPRRIDHVGHTGRHGTGDGFGDDRSRSGPGEDLDLAGGVKEDMTGHNKEKRTAWKRNMSERDEDEKSETVPKCNEGKR